MTVPHPRPAADDVAGDVDELAPAPLQLPGLGDVPTTPDELAGCLMRLETLAPVDRATSARRLVDVAKALLSATADAAVVEAIAEAGGRFGARAEVARQLQVSGPAVDKATRRHAARLAGRPVVS